MSKIPSELFARLEFPQSRRVIPTGRSEPLPISRDCQVVDWALVTCQNAHHITGKPIPKYDRAVLVTGYEDPAGRRKFHCHHETAVASQSSDFPLSLKVPNLHKPFPVCGR